MQQMSFQLLVRGLITPGQVSFNKSASRYCILDCEQQNVGLSSQIIQQKHVHVMTHPNNSDDRFITVSLYISLTCDKLGLEELARTLLRLTT